MHGRQVWYVTTGMMVPSAVKAPVGHIRYIYMMREVAVGALPSGKRRWRFYLWTALGVKAGMLLVILFLFTNITGVADVPLVTGDTPSYLLPIDSLVEGHGYTPDFRMPGYGGVYLLFRAWLPSTWAQLCLIILQWVADAVIVVLATRVAWRLGASIHAERCVFLVACISTFVSLNALFVMTETFTVLCVLLCIDQALAWNDRPTRTSALIAGAAVAWAIFLRPVFGILLPIIGLWFFLGHRRSKAVSWSTLIFFALPFAVADGAWIARNYHAHGRFIPLTDGMFYPDFMSSPTYDIFPFVQAIGGNTVWWADGAEIRYFHSELVCLDETDVRLPAWITTSEFTMDSLRLVSDDAGCIVSDTCPGLSPLERRRLVKDRMERYTRSFRTEHPWHYHVTARLRLAATFLFRSGIPESFDAPLSRMPLAKQIGTILNTVLFVVVSVGGTLMGIVLILSKDPSRALRFVSIAALITSLMFPLLFRVVESRYLAPAFPLLIIILILGIASFGDRRLRLHVQRHRSPDT